MREVQEGLADAEKERARIQMLEKKNKKKGAMIQPPGAGGKAANLQDAELQLNARVEELQLRQVRLANRATGLLIEMMP